MPLIVKDRTTLGIYIIILLAVLKFVFIPLDKSLKAKRVVLKDYLETYRMASFRRRSEPAREVNTPNEKRILKLMAPKDTPIPVIQTDVLLKVIKMARKNGLTVINFELPEAVKGKNITEVPVIIRLKGMPKSLLDLFMKLKHIKRLIDVTSINISKIGNEFSFAITLTAYRMEK